MSACRHCPAQIVWARTTGGKPMPLDADDDGNLRTYPADDASTNVAVREKLGTSSAGFTAYTARVLAAGEQPRDGELRAMPHFATCTGWNR